MRGWSAAALPVLDETLQRPMAGGTPALPGKTRRPLLPLEYHYRDARAPREDSEAAKDCILNQEGKNHPAPAVGRRGAWWNAAARHRKGGGKRGARARNRSRRRPAGPLVPPV